MVHRLKYSWLFSASFCPLLCAVFLSSSSARAQILYDASPGTLPEAQGWSYLALGPATEVMSNNSVLFDTMASIGTYAGWSQVSGTDLNRAGGFTFLFNVMMNAETHVSTNRAGFSIIVLGNDKHGIELGFWTNTIFAQTDNPLFTHGEQSAFAPPNSFVRYALSLFATNYVLMADGAAILSGPIRDYTAFNGIINPYRTANFVFFGDDTGSASGSINIRSVTLIMPPQLTLSNGVISWTGVSNQVYTVQSSANLLDWSAAGTSASSTTSYHFTNSPAQSGRFFRVVYP